MNEVGQFAQLFYGWEICRIDTISLKLSHRRNTDRDKCTAGIKQQIASNSEIGS